MEKMDLTHAPPHPAPAVYAGEFELLFPEPVAEGLLAEKGSGFFSALLDFLYRKGCRLIGHVKGLIQPEEGGFLLLSATSFQSKPGVKGNLPDRISRARLTLNVIVFGVSVEKIRRFVEAEVKKLSRS
jgi:hypothetical protein